MSFSPDSPPWLTDERGSVRKPWGVPLHIALAFPNTYFLAMSNLGWQTIYTLFNFREDVLCERAVFPGGSDVSRAAQKGRRTLRTLESNRPLGDFNVIAFSLPFENDYPHVLEMLALAGIPAAAQARGDFDPLVIAGGKAVSANPEPLAPFLDAIVLGEAEPVIEELTDRLLQGVLDRAPRSERLQLLADLPSLYLPANWKPEYTEQGVLRSMENLTGAPAPAPALDQDLDGSALISPLSTPHTEFADMHLIEVSRGCPRGCRFCLTCWSAQRYRLRSAEALWREIEQHTLPGATIGLIGASLGDYPYLAGLGERVLASGRRISLSSLRIESFTPEVAELMIRSGQRTLTLAPEAASHRLRVLMNKEINEEQLHLAAQTAAQAGFHGLKLYFLTGLPSETVEEAEAIVELLKRLRHHLRRTGRSETAMSISASVSCYVPKPLTPWQWTAMAEERDLLRKTKSLQRAAPRGQGISIQTDVPKWALFQGLLARGDRRAAPLLEALAQGETWPGAAKRININPAFYLHRERAVDECLPWDHLCPPALRGRLAKEYLRFQEVLTHESL